MSTPFEIHAAGRERAAQMNAVTAATQQLVAMQLLLDEQGEETTKMIALTMRGEDIGITLSELLEEQKIRNSAAQKVAETFIALAEELEKRWGINA